MGHNGYRIAIIGAGKVGVAVGRLLQEKGHRVVAAAATSDASLEAAAPFLPGARLVKDAALATPGADIIFITTKDGQIKPACDELARRGAIGPQHTVIHMSGALSLDVLATAERAGARIASIHPIQSFASAELALALLAGSYFGVTAEGAAREVALALVAELGGTAVEVPDESKTLYHAAACVASNYLVTLLHLAERLYEAAGFTKEAAVAAMMPLVKGTLANIERVGTVPALTGPIVRSDATIIEQHMQSLRSLGDDVAELYGELGLHTVAMAKAYGRLNEKDAAALKSALKGGKS